MSDKIARMKTILPNYDRVNLVNDQDEIIASADKLEAHLGNALLHQAISLFLFKKNKLGGFDLLIQKRSQEKIVAAGEWGNTVCGNVAVGENHQQCLWRRLREELGINFPKNIYQQAKELAVINYHVACNQKYSEREIDHIFALFLNDQEVTDFKIKLNPSEVSELTWVKWSELKQKTHIAGLKFAPWVKIFLNNTQLIKAIDHYLENLAI